MTHNHIRFCIAIIVVMSLQKIKTKRRKKIQSVSMFGKKGQPKRGSQQTNKSQETKQFGIRNATFGLVKCILCVCLCVRPFVHPKWLSFWNMANLNILIRFAEWKQIFYETKIVEHSKHGNIISGKVQKREMENNVI